jgi:hypothetical protein
MGRPISFPDTWIAASALQLNIPLVTHNAGDYEAIDGLTILTATQRSSGFQVRQVGTNPGRAAKRKTGNP